MSRKSRHGGSKGSRSLGPDGSKAAIPPDGGPGVPPESGDIARVKTMIARGESKSALDLAKRLHKGTPSAASEALLIDAYLSRVQAMAAKEMWEEAEALLALVRERHPQASPSLNDVGRTIALRRGKLDDLLRPLRDPDLPREQREAIEKAISEEIVDLSALAGCLALSSDDALRRGASSLIAAFEAVTQGPVSDEALALPDVARRGPLAPWKSLLQAIAAFYRREDETCRRFLAAIDPTSVPARLVPALEAMLAGTAAAGLSEPAARLAGLVEGGQNDLMHALKELEAAFTRADRRKILPQIRSATDLCRRAAPELLDRLRKQIAARGATLDIPERELAAALGGAPRRDAEFLRLMACAIENFPGFPPSEAAALAFPIWDNFRNLALHEGRIQPGSVDEATFFLHLAELLAALSDEDLLDARATYADCLASYAMEEPMAGECLTSPEDFSPQVLFERACAIDPHAEAFRSWFAWARMQRSAKPAEHVAEAWHRALPGDVQPLLFLTTSTQRRGAFQAALGWLEKAERLDAVNPEVHRTKMRLLVDAAVRHLQTRKYPLIEKDVAALAALPQCREGDRPAFLDGLRWASLTRQKREREAEEVHERICLQLGRLGTYALLMSLASRDKTAPGAAGIVAPAVGEGEILAWDLGRACALGDDMGFPATVPQEWEERLIEELTDTKRASTLPPAHLLSLATATTMGRSRELQYAATVAGIERGTDVLARFLVMRAAILPQWEETRRVNALAVALELSRRQRDAICIDHAMLLKPSLSFFGQRVLEDRGRLQSPEKIAAILDGERQERAYPRTKRRPSPPWPRATQAAEEGCDCPTCRAADERKQRRKEAASRQGKLFES